MKNNIETTIESLEKELNYAIMYRKMLEEWLLHLSKAPVFQESGTLLLALWESLRSSLIFSMANIFSNSKEVGLWRLIEQVEEQGKSIANKGDRKQQIRVIQEKLNPLRNIERAHNIPWRERSSNNDVPLSEIGRWLSLAESLYQEIFCVLGKACPLNGMGEFDTQLKRNIILISQIPDQNCKV